MGLFDLGVNVQSPVIEAIKGLLDSTKVTQSATQAQGSADSVAAVYNYAENWTALGLPFSNDSLLMEGMILATWAKLYKTDPKLLAELAEKYMDTIGNVITSMERSSASNWLTAMLNQSVAVNMLSRLGILNEQARAYLLFWYNHVFGEMEKLNALASTIGPLTTLGGSIIGAIGTHGGE